MTAMKEDGHIARLGKKTSGYILAGKYSGKKPFRRNGDI
jgi:hypothetical protein